MFNLSPQNKELAFNVLGQLAANTLGPKIMPQGIDTSYSGVGLGNINLGTASGIGNYGTSAFGAAQAVSDLESTKIIVISSIFISS